MGAKQKELSWVKGSQTTRQKKNLGMPQDSPRSGISGLGAIAGEPTLKTKNMSAKSFMNLTYTNPSNLGKTKSSQKGSETDLGKLESFALTKKSF